MKHLLCLVLCCCWFLSAEAFVSKIRSETNKLPCHQVADAFIKYVRLQATTTQLLARLNILCDCTLAGADITDLNAVRGVLDAMTVPDIGSTAPLNAMEAEVLLQKKLGYVDSMEKGCGTFELNNDLLVTEGQFRTQLTIPNPLGVP